MIAKTIRAATAAAALIAAGASPALAQQTVTANAQGGAAQSARAPSAGNGGERVCVRTTLSGSRLTRNVCRTRAEWQRMGGYEEAESR